MELNQEQRQVVETLRSNILLLASAGTGKTGTLAARVAAILTQQLATPEEILCLTFTNKASREMKQAITKRIGTDGQRVKATTFHQFCLSILQEEAKHSSHFYHEMVVFDEEECALLLQEVTPELSKWLKPQDLASLVTLMKEEMALLGERDYVQLHHWLQLPKAQSLIQQKLTFVKNIEEVLTYVKERGAKVLERYDALLQDQHAVDFTDLITYVYVLFKNKEILVRWASRYRYVMVDEVQDTSVLEYQVLKPLLPTAGTLFCGDFFQTIYSWRGSRPELVLGDYRKNFQPVEIAFYDNYRSTKELFNISLATLQKMFPKEMAGFYETAPRAASKEEGQIPSIWEASTVQEEGEAIFTGLFNRWQQGERSLCVLVRNNQYAQELSTVFAKQNGKLAENLRLPFLLVDQFKFYRREEIKDALAFFKVLVNPYDLQSTKRILKRFVTSVGEATIRTLDSAETRKTGLRLTDFLDFRIFQGDLYEPLWEGLAAGDVVVFDVESTGTDTSRDEIIQIAAIKLGPTGEVVDTFERFIRPNRSVGTSELVHGFSDAWLAENGEEAGVVFDDFRKFFTGSVVVGHNVSYDMSILKSHLARTGRDMIRVKGVFDTLNLYRRFYPNEKKHTLEYLSERFHTKHRPSHNAMDDITATAELLVRSINEDLKPNLDARRALTLRYKDAFGEMASRMATLRRKAESELPSGLLVYIMNEMGLKQKFVNDPPRLNRIRELYRILQEQEKEGPYLSVQDALHRALEVATLSAGEGMARMGNEAIPIITVHQAKGSEFDHVFLAGMMDGVFPSFLSMKEGNEEEEKRLFYVAITRPKKSLVISYARERFGRKASPSSLLKWLPNRVLKEKV